MMLERVLHQNTRADRGDSGNGSTSLIGYHRARLCGVNQQGVDRFGRWQFSQHGTELHAIRRSSRIEPDPFPGLSIVLANSDSVELPLFQLGRRRGEFQHHILDELVAGFTNPVNGPEILASSRHRRSLFAHRGHRQNRIDPEWMHQGLFWESHYRPLVRADCDPWQTLRDGAPHLAGDSVFHSLAVLALDDQPNG